MFKKTAIANVHDALQMDIMMGRRKQTDSEHLLGLNLSIRLIAETGCILLSTAENRAVILLPPRHNT